MATGAQLEKSAPAMPGQPQLSGRLAGLWGMARVRWAQLEPGQRRSAVVAALLLGGLLGGLFWYGLRTDWRTLYAGLDADDAQQISQTLTAAKIPFDVTADGSGIRVPAPYLDKARLAAAAKGGVKSGRMGFELFDKPNWVGSEFDEQVNYQRALEGELERTIESLSDIQSAHVDLVLLHDSLFRDQDRPAKASVVIKLRQRTLAEGEADAIRNLVAGAVDGLTPDHVVLVDADGHLPLGPQTPEALQLSAEQALEEKLVQTLEPVTGPGNVRASVTLDYDDKATDTTQEIYDPNQTVTLSMQRSDQSTGAQAVAAGVPGAASNAPNAQAVPVYPHETTPPETAKTESGTYAASKTVRHVIENPGQIERLTAAIVVNDRMIQPASGGRPAVWQHRSPGEVRNLTALAQAAVGYDAARGDMLTVEDLPFEGNRAAPGPALAERLLNRAASNAVLIKYLALIVAVLLVLAFGVRPALRRAAGTPAPRTGKEAPRELAAGAVAQAQSALKANEPAELDQDRVRAQEILEQVSSHLKREPTQSSRLLQSWIHSD
ncbi:MAG: flagellar basal-body MS-ring/collar protein FliF [Terracidiphilus sp.]